MQQEGITKATAATERGGGSSNSGSGGSTPARRKKAEACNGCGVGRPGGVPAPRANMCVPSFFIRFLLCACVRPCREEVVELKRTACECCLLFFVSFFCFRLTGHRRAARFDGVGRRPNFCFLAAKGVLIIVDNLEDW